MTKTTYTCVQCNAPVLIVGSSIDRTCTHGASGVIAHVSATATGVGGVEEHPIKYAFLRLFAKLWERRS